MENIKESMLYKMKRIREIELRIAKEYSKQKIRCPVHLSIGQEAPAAALSCVLNKSDYSVSTHRGHAHYLAKGGNLNSLISEIYGKKDGCSSGKGGSMHLIDKSVNFMGTSAIVGNSIPTGTGLALAAKLNNKKQISVIHFGDGAIEEGVFYESLNFASLRKIPALFFCENNFYSVYSPLTVRQPKGRSIANLANQIGAKSFIDNGENPLSTYKKVKEAVDFCREQRIAVFLELKTYRWLEHCGPNNDDHLKYRDPKEIEFWRQKDPIYQIEKDLSQEEKKRYQEKVKLIEYEINASFNYALASQPPKESEAHTNIFSS